MKTILCLLFSAIFCVHQIEASSCSKHTLPKKNTSKNEDFKVKLETTESKLEGSIAELKKSIEDTNKIVAELKTELAALKGQKPAVIHSEVLSQMESQKQSLADSKELEHILVKYGNNPDGMSTLHYAIKQGDVNAVNLLIANGADVNSKDGKFTTLTRAALWNQFEVTQVLLSLGADINLVVSDVEEGPTWTCAINYAAGFGSGELVTLLAEHGAILDRTYPKDLYTYATTPLHTAAKKGNYEAVVALVEAGAYIDGNIPHNIGGHQTPLELAAENLKFNDNPQNLELVKFLVENGATRRNVRYFESQGPNHIPCSVISGYLQSMRR